MARTCSRLGFVYYPDDRHYARTDLEAWLPVLQGLGAHWLTLRASLSRAIPESFVQGLLEAGIQPIVHIPIRVDQANLPDATPLFECYRHWGIRHVVVFDRPNQRTSWPASEWGKSGLVERFIDRALPILQAQQAAGLSPVLPPLQPGGDYWDTAFLSAVLSALARRGQQSLLRDLHLGLYSWPGEHPLDWGAGGPKRWPKAQPYASDEDSQDQRGFRIFEWYSAIAEEAIGAALPTMALAGGFVPTDHTDESLAQHAEQNVAIARTITKEEPEALLAFCFHRLTARSDSPDALAAWFPAPTQPLPAADAFRRFLQEQPQGKNIAVSPLRKYILLPASGGEQADRVWTLAGKLARLDRATVGYSIEDACLASDVTLIGDALAHGKDVEPRLRAAGCEVRRLDPATLEAIPLDHLAASASPSATTLVRQE
jgi:hypothetical protein